MTTEQQAQIPDYTFSPELQLTTISIIRDGGSTRSSLFVVNATGMVKTKKPARVVVKTVGPAKQTRSTETESSTDAIRSSFLLTASRKHTTKMSAMPLSSLASFPRRPATRTEPSSKKASARTASAACPSALAPRTSTSTSCASWACP